MLSGDELKRYNRHILLKEIGLEGQQRLKQAKVLVLGAGGLGCPVLQYLTAAGVGTIGIADEDVVEESNLQRQVLYNSYDVGKKKAVVAAEKLKALNPFVDFKVYAEKIDKQNALAVFTSFDIIVDGTDNFPTRYLANDACVILNKTLVSGSIFKFEGQVSVYNFTFPDGSKGPTYRCLFPEAPGPGESPSCSEAGVLGVLPGIIGSVQANEVIKLITGAGEPLIGKLLVFDALTLKSSLIKFNANPENFKINTLAEYEEVCDMKPQFEPGYKEINVKELKSWQDKNQSYFLLDVREQYEAEIAKINGGVLIPMNTIRQHIEKIPTDQPVVVYCHHGMRSAMIVKFLSEEFQFNNLYNLEGGIHAWSREIDPLVPIY